MLADQTNKITIRAVRIDTAIVSEYNTTKENKATETTYYSKM